MRCMTGSDITQGFLQFTSSPTSAVVFHRCPHALYLNAVGIVTAAPASRLSHRQAVYMKQKQIRSIKQPNPI